MAGAGLSHRCSRRASPLFPPGMFLKQRSIGLGNQHSHPQHPLEELRSRFTSKLSSAPIANAGPDCHITDITEVVSIKIAIAIAISIAITAAILSLSSSNIAIHHHYHPHHQHHHHHHHHNHDHYHDHCPSKQQQQVYWRRRLSISSKWETTTTIIL